MDEPHMAVEDEANMTWSLWCKLLEERVAVNRTGKDAWLVWLWM